MPRAASDKKRIAEKLFRAGMKLADIAKKLEIPEGTVRSWKNREGWDCNVAKKKRNVAKETAQRKKYIADEVEEVIENAVLSDKQRLFCIYYIRCFNATRAYQKAYGVDYTTAASIGYRLLEKDGVKEEITRLKKNRLNREMLSEEDIFQKYLDIAFADITDYIEFGSEDVPVLSKYGPVQVKDEETGEKRQLMKRENVVRFKSSAEVDGTILSEVKQGKDGASIKLSDRMKALQWLSDHMNIATERQQAEVALLKAKLGEGKEDKMVDDWIMATSEEGIDDDE